MIATLIPILPVSTDSNEIRSLVLDVNRRFEELYSELKRTNDRLKALEA